MLALSKIKTFFFALVTLFLTSCEVSYVNLRNVQMMPHLDHDRVIRVYMDRYGDFYPKTEVAIGDDFRVRAKPSDSTCASLSDYFTRDKNRMAMLTAAYSVDQGLTVNKAYELVQQKIIAGYGERVQQLIEKEKPDNLVFLVHGFNDPIIPDTIYPHIREKIEERGTRNVYVYVYWDGLDAGGYKFGDVAKIWMPSNYNARWASLSLRRLIQEAETGKQVPIVMITHSLGAGVATGALFNTSHNWKPEKYVSQAKLDRLKQLSLSIPTPTVRIRLGVIAPAIGGAATFCDLNERVPKLVSQTGTNNIDRLVIGYNPFDYAVSKDLFDLSLAPVYGSTTLGCNYYYGGEKKRSEIELVQDTLRHQDYSPELIYQMVKPIRFDTPTRPKTLKNHEHIIPYYIADEAHLEPFIDFLFRN